MSSTRRITAKLLRSLSLPWPEANTDKDSRGRVVIAGGSTMSAGAVMLSGLAALRAGAGKVLLAVPEPLAIAIGVSFPEAGVAPFAVTGKGDPSPRLAARQIAELIPRVDAALLGPGLANESSARQLAKQLLRTAVGSRFVIDAMCVTGLWDQAELVARHRGKLVITPHPGEMAGLTGISKARITAQPERFAQEAATHLECVVVLKGSATVIAQADGPMYRYEGGGVGLATSGSGDVLAGALAALIARGADPLEAAIWSVYLHGEAGRRLAQRAGPLGFLARELPAQIPGLLRELGASR